MNPRSGRVGDGRRCADWTMEMISVVARRRRGASQIQPRAFLLIRGSFALFR